MHAIEPTTPSKTPRVLLVASRFNDHIVKSLVDGATRVCRRFGDVDLTLVWVPGAWELPAVIAGALKNDRADIVVALGCVIRGETPHFDVVINGTVSALSALQREHATPVGLGLLTTDSLEQAINRAGGKAGNKGEEAANAALETWCVMQALAEQEGN